MTTALDVEPAVLVADGQRARVPDAEPVWLDDGPWPLFGWVHRSAGPAGGGVAVLCPPLLGEHGAAYAVHRSAALALAAAGVTAVRFDYEGTGDSAGPSGGPGRVASWLDGVDQAIAAARLAGAGPLALVGVRSGALVAALAAERRGDVDALVLWDPWRSGRSFLRRQHALHAMRFPASGGDWEIEVPGFGVGAEMAEELSALRLPPRLHARRALLLVRPGQRPVPVPLALSAGGSAARPVAEVQVTEEGEQEACFESEPLECRAPDVTTSRAVEWLRGTLGRLADPPTGRPRAAGAPVTAPVDRTVAVTPASPGEATVYEEPVWLGDHCLFAIETRPCRERPPAGSPVVVLLSSGFDPHVGPSRLWVVLARRWAALGLRCVRVDLSGWGDSAPRPGRPPLVVRAPEAFDDVRELVAAVGGADRAVLVGLCSGAYQALESALEISPLGVLAINPLLRFTPPELAAGGEVDARRRICEPRQPWVSEVRSKLPGAVGATAVGLWRAARRLRSPRSGSWLDGLAASGVHVLCVCGEEEALQLPAAGRLQGVASPGRVRIDVVPGLDHALLPAAQRVEVADRLTTELCRIAGEAAGPQ